MILILSNAGDATVDFFETRLRERGISFLRLNTESFPECGLDYRVTQDSASAAIRIASQTVSLESVASIYYRRPRPADLPGVDDPGLRLWMQNELRQSWGGVLMSAPAIRWVNHPVAIGAAAFKPEQIARAMRHGLTVPESVLTSDPATALRFCEVHRWQVVAKPVGHGEIRQDNFAGDQIVYTNRVDRSCRAALDDVAHCPTLFQRMLAKRYDIRATVVGADCVAVALHSQEREESLVDCRRNNMSGMRYTRVELPTALTDRLITLTRSYGLHYAAIDLVLDPDGLYWFLELNAAGQWAWLEQLAAAPISDALIRCLTRREE